MGTKTLPYFVALSRSECPTFKARSAPKEIGTRASNIRSDLPPGQAVASFAHPNLECDLMEKVGKTISAPITRADLYRQVWSTPLVKLATRYGTTKLELSTLCARMNVPRPPSGYWMKKSAGKPVTPEQLPAPGPETVLETTIRPKIAKPRATPAQIELERQLSKAREAHARLNVPDKVLHPHPVVEEWLQDYERKKQEALRIRDPFHRSIVQPKEFTDLDHRRIRFLDALFKAVEPLGFEVTKDERVGAYLTFKGERIDFTLRERQQKTLRPLQDKRYKGWAKELTPTGDLVFKIKTWLPPEMPCEWRDSSEKPIEWQLGDAVATLLLAGPHLVRQREARAEIQKRQWDEQHKQKLMRERKQQDENRWRRLIELAYQRNQAANVRKLVEELERRPQPLESIGGLSGAEWLDWARRWIERFDPLMREPQEIYGELASISAY